tara:strand:+ start:3950 stop:4201 length:252 start_codon:yes stop_codon:yes gene_type:complete
MKLGNWLNSLSLYDHLIILFFFFLGTYLSNLTLKGLREFYKKRTNNSPYMVKYRITPLALLSLGILYTTILVKIFGGFLGGLG